MQKKSSKKKSADASVAFLKWWPVLGVVVALGMFALYLGGKVTIKSNEVEISTAKENTAASASLDVEQKATAAQDGARAANALGDINKGNGAPKNGAGNSNSKLSGKVRQESSANGKDSEALNAGGNINLN